MGFRTSKARTEETNWSVILNPLHSELDKNRVAQKISELFRLSFEEARELVQNTPMILLDDVSEEIAQQLRGVFEEVRAEVTLTNDALAKRRCFRAVWPEVPNLSFLNSEPVSPVLPPPEKEKPSQIEIVAAPVTGDGSEALARQLREVEGNYLELEQKFGDLEKKHRELQALYEKEIQDNRELKLNSEKDLKGQAETANLRFRTTVEEGEERYQNLKEESHESKKIYEEKIFAYQKETETLKVQLKELTFWHEKATVVEKQLKALQERTHLLESAKETLERSIKERAAEVTLWKEKAQSLAQKSERFESLFEEERKRREEAQEAHRESLEQAERTRQEIESEGLDVELNLQKQLKALQERINLLESTKETIERAFKERVDEVSLWKEKAQGLAQKSERFESLFEEERKRREEAQEAHRESLEQVERTHQEIESQVVETERRRKKCEELEQNQKRLEKEFADFSEEQEADIKRLREANQELEAQLALSQRQARDLLTRVEHQEIIEKRERLNNDLTLKEGKLRELIIRRERLREEAHERDAHAEAIASEQAVLEREILEIKQGQRHLLEQSKLKEKNQRGKRPQQSLAANEPL